MSRKVTPGPPRILSEREYEVRLKGGRARKVAPELKHRHVFYLNDAERDLIRLLRGQVSTKAE